MTPAGGELLARGDAGAFAEFYRRHARRIASYLIPVKPHMEHARVNWLDRDGNTGSRGIRLSPPASGHVKRG